MKNALRSLCLVAALSGCDDPADDVARAEVVESTDPPAPSSDEPASDDGALTIDTAASTFGFEGSKVTGSHVGHFGEWSGQIWLDADEISRSRVAITIQMASVEADVPRLTSHLRSDDFFAVDQFPTATFASTSIEPGAGDEVTVTGDLTLRGQTQAIRFPMHLTVSDGEVVARAEFSIDRQRWGVSYAGHEDDLIRDDVIIRFEVHAPR